MQASTGSDVVTILIVDDDEVDVRVIKRGLQKKGIDNPVVTARDGIEALEIMRGSEGRPPLRWPYLVLLDLNMPRMGGIELLEEIRTDPVLRTSVIFVLTTSDDDQDRTAAYRKNVAGYLLKTRADADFLDLITMLEKFVLTVRFPHQGANDNENESATA